MGAIHLVWGGWRVPERRGIDTPDAQEVCLGARRGQHALPSPGSVWSAQTASVQEEPSGECRGRTWPPGQAEFHRRSGRRRGSRCPGPASDRHALCPSPWPGAAMLWLITTLSASMVSSCVLYMVSNRISELDWGGLGADVLRAGVVWGLEIN
jgi:hypothetical protein